MPAFYRCFPPCVKSFPTTKALNAHISNKPECFERYSQFLLALVVPAATPGLREDSPQNNTQPGSQSSAIGSSPFGAPIHFSPQDSVGGLEALSLDGASTTTEPEHPWFGVQPGMKEPPTDDEREYVEVYPHAGKILRQDQSAYEKILTDIERDSPQNVYYPFASQSEWGLAVFLHNNLTFSEINNFLKLQFMQSRRPSFRSGAALRDRIEQLPQHGPRWIARDITPDYGSPSQTPVLLYRDPVDAIKYLLARPALAEHLEFAPRKVWEDRTQQSRLYSEMWTGNWWWRTQVSLPIGATVIPVILASDKTHLTNFSGDKSAWPIYLSIGNINAKTRNSPSKGTWLTIAYLPIVQFNDHEKIRGTLCDRFFHQCCRTILISLIHPGVSGINIVDSLGNARLCFPRVATYIADYPEQLLINVAGGLNSPTSTATYHDLGNADPSPPRTYAWITERIRQACDTVDPSLVAQYATAARKLGLNGVHIPFWLDLPGYEPDICVSPDLLHGGHMLFRDHVAKWISKLVGATELDRRLQVLQSVVGYRHFKQGISHLKQWSGRDDRELQRIFLAVIAGAPRVTPKALKSVRAFLDFLYLAQYRSHSDTTLEYLEEALRTFHTTKDIFISTGVRMGKKKVIPHFKIPKLAGLHAYFRHIPEMGSSAQYSTEITEHNHQPMAKDAYKATNRINPIEQMARYLERREKVLLFNDFHTWRFERSRADAIEQSLQQYSPRFRAHVLPHLLSARDNRSTSATSAKPTNSRLWLARRPTFTSQEVADVAEVYRVQDLSSAIATFLANFHPRARPIDRQKHVHYMDVWTKLRIRLSSVQSDEEAGQMHVVEAVPPSTHLPYGRCHCVLVNESAEDDVGIEGYRVAQVRLLFQLHMGYTSHQANRVPLAYVQWFSRPKAVAEPNICMYQVSREDTGGVRRGSVIPLDTISRYVQLIPKFGSVVADELTSVNSMDICRDYWVNSFADKEIYQAVW